jgi:hypothetical protein
MATVQFYGKEQVFEAASNLKCPAWALFSGTSLFNKFENDDLHESMQLLEQTLDMLQSSNSVATYKLKFFEIEEGQKKRKINEKTVCDGGSFSFKLQTQEQSLIPYQGRAVAYNETNSKIDKLTQIIEVQQQQIALLAEKIEEEPEEEEEPETLGSVLLDAIKNPDKLMQLVGMFKTITGMGNNQHFNAAIGSTGTPTDQAQQQQAVDQMTLNRIYAAVDILYQADPNLVDHLETLAIMSQDNPGKFKTLISML